MKTILTEMSLARTLKDDAITLGSNLLIDYVMYCLEKDKSCVFSFIDRDGNTKYFIQNKLVCDFMESSTDFSELVVKANRMNNWVLKHGKQNNTLELIRNNMFINMLYRYVEPVIAKLNLFNEKLKKLYDDINKFNIDKSGAFLNSRNQVSLFDISTKDLFVCELLGDDIVSTETRFKDFKQTDIYSCSLCSIILDIYNYLATTFDKKNINFCIENPSSKYPILFLGEIAFNNYREKFDFLTDVDLRRQVDIENAIELIVRQLEDEGFDISDWVGNEAVLSRELGDFYKCYIKVEPVYHSRNELNFTTWFNNCI